MNYDRIYKLNSSVLGFSDETIEKIIDFFKKVSRLGIKLSEKEAALCKSLGVDERLAVLLKSNKVSEIEMLPECNSHGEIVFDGRVDGICALYVTKDPDPTEEIHRALYRNKQAYLKKGYNLFYFSGKFNAGNYMALWKGKNDIDILRWQGTNGINHGIDNELLIAKIEEWQQKYDFVLWGCGADWLHLFFIHEQPKYDGHISNHFGRNQSKYNNQFKLWDKRTPKFNKFADEVIEFCPDLRTQVYGTKKKLIEDMKQMNGVYLWWD